MPNVELADGSVVAFPEGMSHKDIQEVLLAQNNPPKTAPAVRPVVPIPIPDDIDHPGKLPPTSKPAKASHKAEFIRPGPGPKGIQAPDVRMPASSAPNLGLAAPVSPTLAPSEGSVSPEPAPIKQQPQAQAEPVSASSQAPVIPSPEHQAEAPVGPAAQIQALSGPPPELSVPPQQRELLIPTSPQQQRAVGDKQEEQASTLPAELGPKPLITKSDAQAPVIEEPAPTSPPRQEAPPVITAGPNIPLGSSMQASIEEEKKRALLRMISQLKISPKLAAVLVQAAGV